MTAATSATSPAQACSRVDPELFFGPEDSAEGEPMFGWERRALAVCVSCPITVACLASALEFPSAEQHGVIGGATAAQRRVLLRITGRRPARTAVIEEPATTAVALYEAGMGARRIAQQLQVNERRVTGGCSVTGPGSNRSATVRGG